jgi:hypothetical protein
MHRGDRPEAMPATVAPHHHGGCSAGFVRPRELSAPLPPVGAGRRGPARCGTHPRAGQARLHGPLGRSLGPEVIQLRIGRVGTLDRPPGSSGADVISA